MIIERIYDAETGETIERPYNEKEIKAFEKAAEKIASEVALFQAKEAARLAVLEKLGLTADEAAALLG
jgi:phosphopantetheinyl transferase (holo-ACP synthase)